MNQPKPRDRHLIFQDAYGREYKLWFSHIMGIAEEFNDDRDVEDMDDDSFMKYCNLAIETGPEGL